MRLSGESGKLVQPFNRLAQLDLVHLRAVLGGGKRIGTNLVEEAPKRSFDRLGQVRIEAGVPWDVIGVEAEQVVPHEHLTVTRRAGANTDRGHPQSPRDFGGKSSWNE